ncbi:MAG: prepilin-type N-terminal cleavage/methylation domain-containing protein [Isosphaeraceae bacterium]
MGQKRRTITRVSLLLPWRGGRPKRSSVILGERGSRRAVFWTGSPGGSPSLNRARSFRFSPLPRGGSGGGASSCPARLSRRGFTLVELLVVIAIIGIIVSLILVAAMDGVRRAQDRATQALITKLETGLNDRLNALMQSLPTPNYAHGYLAGIYPGGTDPNDNGPLMLPSAILPTSKLPNPACKQTQRAQVIANFDYMKAEMPDVFFLNPAFLSNPSSFSGYPINFTGLPYPGNPLVTLGNYILPMGHMVQGPRNATGQWTEGLGDSHVDPTTGYLVSTHTELGYIGSGIMGASYAAAAGLYRYMGYAPIGYDMIDNDGNGLVDDWAEGISGGNAATIISNLLNHKHITARSEMLYALLVGGVGPLGSVFNPDDFSDREVRDTDGDGLPEFVDAWGQPLQFFRWPILYHSDIQRGQAFVSQSGSSWILTPPYALRGDPNNGPVNFLYQNVFDQREQDPLDPNQQLVAPGWFSTTGAGGLAANAAAPFSITPAIAVPPGVSAAAQMFGTYFHRLTEPFVAPSGSVYSGVYGLDWDRAGALRRAFYTKPLILSAGQDGVPGVMIYPDAYITAFTNADQISAYLIANENVAMPFGWAGTGPLVDFINVGATYSFPGIAWGPSENPLYPSSYDLFNAAQDDITNQNLEAVSGIGGSG